MGSGAVTNTGSGRGKPRRRARGEGSHGDGDGLGGGDDDGLGDGGDDEEEWIGGGGAGQKPIGGGAVQGEEKEDGEVPEAGQGIDPTAGQVCREEGSDPCGSPFRGGHPRPPLWALLGHRPGQIPKKVIRKDSAKKTAKKSRVKVFLKLVNFTHLMPTRYIDVNLKELVSGAPDSLTSKDKKLTAAKSAKAKLEERFKTGKNTLFFTKLRMILYDSRNSIKIYSSHDST
ncbi:60S ribosomal protein L27-3 [Hordeum vulgare]|nr:60S ribosomal protein L27-3 [Hordeum vulgare]